MHGLIRHQDYIHRRAAESAKKVIFSIAVERAAKENLNPAMVKVGIILAPLKALRDSFINLTN